MLGPETITERLKKVLQLSEADQVEAVLMAGESALTRFANNTIHQNVAEANATLYVKAVTGSRTGSATTNDLSDEGLAKAAERALVHARQQPEDPDFPGLSEPQVVMPAEAFDQATVDFSPAARAEAVGAICRLAGDQRLKAFGAYKTMTTELAVANSNGVMLYHPSTTADLQITVSGDDGSGWSQASDWQVDRLDPEALGREAVTKAQQAQSPQPIEPGPYTVVLDPYAVQDILLMLNYTGMGAQEVQEGRSWMNDRMGQAAMSPMVTIWDDGRDPDGAPAVFDFEGQPRLPVRIVEKGVVQGPVYNRYTAHKEGKTSTGHAIAPKYIFFTGPVAQNLFMASGQATLEEMIAGTEKGLYVTRFWYTRTVHPRDCIITGMTRDGVFQIEKGEVTGPVKNLRFTQSYVQALANVEAVGRARRTLIDDYGDCLLVPALKIKDFTFTGRTA
jgi:predicted Zn-dependent protease